VIQIIIIMPNLHHYAKSSSSGQIFIIIMPNLHHHQAKSSSSGQIFIIRPNLHHQAKSSSSGQTLGRITILQTEFINYL
jgi:quercetin dioxygenase-like cupin family protein